MVVKVLSGRCTDEQLESEGGGENKNVGVHAFFTNDCAIGTGVRVSGGLLEKEQRTSVRHETMKVVLRPLHHLN